MPRPMPPGPRPRRTTSRCATAKASRSTPLPRALAGRRAPSGPASGNSRSSSPVIPCRTALPLPPNPLRTKPCTGAGPSRHNAKNDLQIHLHPRRARAQSQEYLARFAAREARGDHRTLGLRQVLARLRHDLCRGPAALCRVAVGLCAAVPRHDAEARRGPYRGPVAGHLHRAEDHLEEPAFDGRHRHRDLRLYAAALGAGRRALLARRPGSPSRARR